MPRATKTTPRKNGSWVPRFLEVFRDCANVRLACHACGIDRSTAYRRREKDTKFREAWDRAEEEACDLLEFEARKRAKSSSDVLLMFLLKGARPEKYRERLDVRVLKEQAKEEAAREVAAAPVEDLLAQMDYEYAGTDAAS